MAQPPSNPFSDFEREALAHVPSLLAVARRLTRSKSEAEDLVQDTLLKALRARQHFQPGTHLKAWLFKILRNTFFNQYHRGVLERSVTGGSAVPDPVTDGWISNASMRTMRDAEGNALRPELQQRLTQALDQIPEDFRIVVLLADVEECSYREIAEAMDCPIGTVMSRLHRGRKLLRAQLVDFARESGILTPEEFIGSGAEKNDADTTAKSTAPVDLDAYREVRVAASKPRRGG
jgi:RNA polymerase sigma-70 factor, ECF subfamily